MDNGQTPSNVVNVWIFVLPEKENSTDWETRTEKPVQIALTISLFFSAALKLLLNFSKQLHNAHKNSNCLYTCQILTLPIRGVTRYEQFHFVKRYLKLLNQNNFILYLEMHFTEWRRVGGGSFLAQLSKLQTYIPICISSVNYAVSPLYVAFISWPLSRGYLCYRKPQSMVGLRPLK